jgi:hypothetical protein
MAAPPTRSSPPRAPAAIALLPVKASVPLVGTPEFESVEFESFEFESVESESVESESVESESVESESESESVGLLGVCRLCMRILVVAERCDLAPVAVRV